MHFRIQFCSHSNYGRNPHCRLDVAEIPGILQNRLNARWVYKQVLWPPVIRVFVIHLHTKIEVRRPFRSEYMTHFRYQHWSAWWHWPFTFWPRNWCALLYVVQANCSFHSLLVGQHLSDAWRWRELATLTFDLEVETGALYCRWAGNHPTIFGISRTFHYRIWPFGL